MKASSVLTAIVVSTIALGDWAIADSEADAAAAKLYCLSASPDGKSLAICIEVTEGARKAALLDLSTRDVKFFNVPADAIIVPPYRASWLPDSSGFVFVTVTRQNTADPLYMPSWDIWLAMRGTGRARDLVDENSRECWAFPRVSPDGKRLVVGDMSPSTIVLIDVGSGRYRRLLPATVRKQANVSFDGFDWDPSGEAVYVSVGWPREQKTEESGLWRIDVASGAKERLSKKSGWCGLSVSPNGQWLAFSEIIWDEPSRDRGLELKGFKMQVASLPACKVRELSDHGTESSSWSKDKDRLAFCEKGQIAVWSPSSNETVRMPVPEGQPGSLSWIGSTDSVAYGVDDREIWMLDTTSRERKRIITAAEVLKKLNRNDSK